jgi:tryptophan synthase alpha chain
MLADKILEMRRKKPMLLMAHLVLGFPSYEENRKLIAEMVASGVELIEMQLPFSEPMADGPVILRANDEALRRGATTGQGLSLAAEMTAAYPDTLFVFMSYYNVLYTYGVSAFVSKTRKIGVRGLIVPDLPPEEGEEYLAACEKEKIAPIFLFTPTSTPERLKLIQTYCRGLTYCVGRRGVTGAKTRIDNDLKKLIARYRAASKLPLGLGFGIQTKKDVASLKGLIDIAILGTKIVELDEEKGAKAVGKFLRGLRSR